MKYSIQFIFILAFTFKASGQTCLVFVRTPTQIFIGADTKTTRTISYLGSNNEPKFRLDSFSTCKIFNQDNVFFCFSGSSNSELNAAARASISLKKSLLETVNDFKTRAIPAIEKILINDKRSRAKYEFIKSQHVSIKAAFCGFENSIPKIVLIAFDIESKGFDSSLRIVPSLNDGHTFDLKKAGRPMDIALESTDSAYNVAINYAWSPFTTESIKSGIIKIIESDMKFNPDHVGKPIDILEIKENSKSVILKGKCN